MVTGVYTPSEARVAFEAFSAAMDESGLGVKPVGEDEEGRVVWGRTDQPTGAFAPYYYEGLPDIGTGRVAVARPRNEIMEQGIDFMRKTLVPRAQSYAPMGQPIDVASVRARRRQLECDPTANREVHFRFVTACCSLLVGEPDSAAIDFLMAAFRLDPKGCYPNYYSAYSATRAMLAEIGAFVAVDSSVKRHGHYDAANYWTTLERRHGGSSHSYWTRAVLNAYHAECWGGLADLLPLHCITSANYLRSVWYLCKASVESGEGFSTDVFPAPSSKGMDDEASLANQAISLFWKKIGRRHETAML